MARLKFSILFICIIYCSQLGSYGQSMSIGFHFRGLENKRIILGYYEGNKHYVKDSLQLDNRGEGTWRRDSPLAEGLYFVVLPGSRYFDLLIAENEHFQVYSDTTDLVGKMRIVPEGESSYYLNYQKAARQLQVQYDKAEAKLKFELPDSVRRIRQHMRLINLQLERLKDSLILAYHGSLTSKIMKLIRSPIPSINAASSGNFREQYQKTISTFTDAIDLTDERLLNTPFIWSRLDSYFNHLLVQKNDSLISAITLFMNKAVPHRVYKDFFKKWLLENYAQKKFPGSEKTYVFIAQQYFLQPSTESQDSSFLAHLKFKVEKTLSIIPGASPQNLDLPDTSGKIHSIAKTQQKDIILLFYDSECGPCKYVKSQIIALLNRLDSREICVYAINLSENRSEWLNYIKGTGPEWIHVSGFEKKELLSQEYNFEFLPSLFLIGPDKKIVAGNINFSEIETILRGKYSYSNRKN